MKRNNRFVFRLMIFTISLLIFSNISGQEILITSDADTVAFVDEPYTYAVNAVTSPSKYPITYSLLDSLSGMTINDPVPGYIKWKPTTITAGGKVIVKATNNVNESDTQEFFIYVSDAINCPPTMEAYWKLDEAGGPVYYDCFGDNNAYVTGNAPTSVTGKIDKAQEFDFTNNQKLFVPKDPIHSWQSDENFSIEFWISMKEANIEDSVQVIIGKNEGSSGVHWWVGIDVEEKINFIIRGAGGNYSQCTSDPINTAWHHVAVTRDASAEMIYLYLNGELVDSDIYDGNGPGLLSDSSLCIGWLRPGQGYYERYPYNGKLDELIIHNDKLTDQEVTDRYLKGYTGKPACREGNFAPLFISTPVTEINEDSPYSYHYVARDIDGDPLVYSVTIPAWLSHNAGTRTISGTPTNSQVGTFPVSIKVNDGSPDTVFQNFNITVSNVNDPPLLSNIGGSALSFTEGDLPLILTTTIVIEDVDDTTIESASVSISNNYMNGEDVLAFSNTPKITGSWNSSTGVLTLTGNDTKANYQTALKSIAYNNTSEDPSSLTRIISINVNDGEANSNTLSRDVSVIPVNDLPVITGFRSVNTPEDDTILIRLNHIIYHDVDNTADEITLTVKNGSHYTFAGNIVTPESNYYDTMHVNIQVSDLSGTVSYTLPVYVIPVNDSPVFTFSTPPAAYEGAFYFHTISAEDADVGDVLSFSAPKLPSWLQLTGNMLTGKPGFQHVGENTVTVRVTDGKVNVDTTFIINVIMTDHPPFIISTPVTAVDEDKDYVYNIQYQDPDTNDILILSADIIPDWLILDENKNELRGKPTNDQVGFKADSAYIVKLRISDTKLDSTQTFEIVVKNINDAPQISGQVIIPLIQPSSSILISLDDLIVEDVDNPLSDLELTILPGAGYSITDKTVTINSGVLGRIEINVAVDDGITESEVYGYKVDVGKVNGIQKIDVNDNDAVNVYPNPAYESVRFELNLNNEYRLEVFSNAGKLLLSKSIEKGENVFELNTGDMDHGIYYYKIYNNLELYTGKLIIK